MGKQLLLFFALVTVTVGVTYFTPTYVGSVFFIGTLIAYFRSKNEAFWLAFFLVISEGIFSLLGKNEVMLSVIPGLPEVEVAQLYILLTLVKASRVRLNYRPFHYAYLLVLLVYIGFLVVQGLLIGLTTELNIIFRVIKLLIPLLLLYSIPRLFPKTTTYEQFFAYLFPVALIALLTQLFAVTVGLSPADLLGVTDEIKEVKVREAYPYRGFFSVKIVLLSLFGAMFFIAKKGRILSRSYLYVVVATCFLIAFFSATRGWIIGFGLTLFLFMAFILRFDAKQLAIMGIATAAIIGSSLFVPIIEMQLYSAFNRMLTLGALAEGDITAGKTLVRLNTRSPRVMKKWDESKLTGWGFSDTYFEYSDGHVANQSILLHGGIIGMLLLYGFFGYFQWKLLLLHGQLPRNHLLRDVLLVFIFFFVGWFIIHSSSGQQFGFYLGPPSGMIQAVFFSLGALVYNQAFTFMDDNLN